MEILTILGSIASILSACFALWAAIRSGKLIQFLKGEDPEKWDMREELGKLNHVKEKFWGLLERAYADYRKHNPTISESIQDFLNIVKIPQELLNATDLRHVEIMGNSDQRTMDDFVRKIYPFDKNTRLSKKEDSIFLDQNDFEEFNRARSDLSEFWDRWTKKRSLKKIKEEYSGEKNLIAALSWLDYAHRTFVNEPNKLKEKMYELGHLFFQK